MLRARRRLCAPGGRIGHQARFRASSAPRLGAALLTAFSTAAGAADLIYLVTGPLGRHDDHGALPPLAGIVRLRGPRGAGLEDGPLAMTSLEIAIEATQHA